MLQRMGRRSVRSGKDAFTWVGDKREKLQALPPWRPAEWPETDAGIVGQGGNATTKTKSCKRWGRGN